MPLGALGKGFPNVQQTRHFFDAQDLGSMGGRNNPGFKIQDPSSSPCLVASC